MENIDINIGIQKFETNFNNLLIESQLPVGVLCLILKNFYNDIEKQYIGYINSYNLSHDEYVEIDNINSEDVEAE